MAAFTCPRPLVKVLRVVGPHNFSVVSCEDGAKFLFAAMIDLISEYLTSRGVAQTSCRSRASSIGGEVTTTPAVTTGSVSDSSVCSSSSVAVPAGDCDKDAFDPCIGEMLLSMDANGIWKRSMLLDIIFSHGTRVYMVSYWCACVCVCVIIYTYIYICIKGIS